MSKKTTGKPNLALVSNEPKSEAKPTTNATNIAWRGLVGCVLRAGTPIVNMGQPTAVVTFGNDVEMLVTGDILTELDLSQDCPVRGVLTIRRGRELTDISSMALVLNRGPQPKFAVCRSIGKVHPKRGFVWAKKIAGGFVNIIPNPAWAIAQPVAQAEAKKAA